MTCTIDKFTTYEASQVVRDGNRIVVRLARPPASCPDGVLNNSHTIVQENAAVSRPIVSFSSKLGVPVVLMPHGQAVMVREDPIDTPKDTGGIGWFGWVVIILLLGGGIYWLIKRKGKEEDSSNPDPSPADRKPEPPAPKPEPTTYAAPVQSGLMAQPAQAGTTASTTHVHHHHSSPAPQTTVIVQGGQRSSGDGLVEGMVLGSILSRGNDGHDRTIIERDREVIREREVVKERDKPADEEPTTYSSDDDSGVSSDDDDSSGVSSDDDSSYSSDDSSSSSSDDSSSIGSDD